MLDTEMDVLGAKGVMVVFSKWSIFTCENPVIT